MRTLLASIIIFLSYSGGTVNAQVTNKNISSPQSKKTKKVYLPKSVKNFTGDGKIDQKMIPIGTKDKPTYIRLWRGKFNIFSLVGYVNIIVEPKAEITYLYQGSGRLNASIFAKNGSKVNIAKIIDQGLDKIHLEKKVAVKTLSGIVMSQWVREGDPIPEKLKNKMERYDKITIDGKGNKSEFYKKYTSNASNHLMPKYKLGVFNGSDYVWDKYEGRDINMSFNYNPGAEILYISVSTKYSQKNRGYRAGDPEWMYVDGRRRRMGRKSVRIAINSNTKDFIKIGKISYTILERNKVTRRQYFDPGLAIDLRPLKKDMAERKRKEAIEAEKKRQMAAKQAKIDAYNANPKNWRRGDRVCLRVIGSVFGFGVINQEQPIRAVIEFFNEDRSRVKVKILESRYDGTIDGEEIYKGNFIWITPQATYRGNTKWMLCK